MTKPLITVLGSVNLDYVATGRFLPTPGETVTGAQLAVHPGGKGGNQALAAMRLGAEVRLIARVGADPMADQALALLRSGGVDLTGCTADPSNPTGVALIAVAATGENQIIVAPGANAAFIPELLTGPIEGALICQLELPPATVAKAMAAATGFICVNLAPAAEVEDIVLQRADLLVVNEGEANFYGSRLHGGPGLVAITLGGEGAGLFRQGRMVASALPPHVRVVDTTGAGDAFVAALTLGLLEGMSDTQAVGFACAAGAQSTTRAGAQPSLPTRAEVDDLFLGDFELD